MQEPCAATLQLTSDLGSGSPLAEALLRPPRRESQLTLLQLDRSQFLPLAALQLLRHAASGGGAPMIGTAAAARAPRTAARA